MCKDYTTKLISVILKRSVKLLLQALNHLYQLIFLKNQPKLLANFVIIYYNTIVPENIISFWNKLIRKSTSSNWGAFLLYLVIHPIVRCFCQICGNWCNKGSIIRKLYFTCFTALRQIHLII